MDIKSVPQDNSETYANMKKAIYATGEDGKMQTVGSIKVLIYKMLNFWHVVQQPPTSFYRDML